MVNEDKKKEYYEMKFDQGKPRWDLVDLKIVEVIAKVLTYGLKDHKANSWKLVPDAKERYKASFMRHVADMISGDPVDEESGLPNSWLAMCNLYFLIWFEQNEGDTE